MLFNDTRNIEKRNLRTKQFGKTKGWRKGALSVLGYKDDGTKNTFGKYFMPSNPLTDHYLPRSIAQGDSKDVIASGESESWTKLFKTANFAKDIATLGAGGGGGLEGLNSGSELGGVESVLGSGNGGIESFSEIGSEGLNTDLSGAFQKGLSGSDGLGSGFDSAGGSSSLGDLGSSIFGSGEGSKKLDLLKDSSFKDQAMERLNKDVEDIDIEELLNNDEESIDENDYENAPEYVSDGQKVSKKLSSLTKGVPALGSGIDMFSQNFVIDDKLKNEKRKIKRKKMFMPNDSQNYL